LHDDRLIEPKFPAGSTNPAASNRISTILPGTMRSSTKMMTEIPNRVTSIKTRRRTI